MMPKSPSKHLLLHPIENHRTTSHTIKNIPSAASASPSRTHTVGVNTDRLQIKRDIGTSTPNYAEQMAKAMDNGGGNAAAEEIVQMLMQAEASESYWKLMKERRQQAIEETHVENQQLHGIIEDLSKENENLRVLADHCDYLQNIFQTLNAENDSGLDGTNTDDSPSSIA